MAAWYLGSDWLAVTAVLSLQLCYYSITVVRRERCSEESDNNVEQSDDTTGEDNEKEKIIVTTDSDDITGEDIEKIIVTTDSDDNDWQPKAVSYSGNCQHILYCYDRTVPDSACTDILSG